MPPSNTKDSHETAVILNNTHLPDAYQQEFLGEARRVEADFTSALYARLFNIPSSACLAG